MLPIIRRLTFFTLSFIHFSSTPAEPVWVSLSFETEFNTKHESQGDEHLKGIKTHCDHTHQNCDGVMALRKSHSSILGKAFVCRKCRKQMNWTKGTFLDSVKLPILLYLKLIFYWCDNFNVLRTAKCLGLSRKTVHHHFKILRMVYYNILNRNQTRIGGAGHIIEIDETMVFRRKSHKGRLTQFQNDQIWVFGGIDRETKLCFAEVVEKRDEQTLLSVLKKYVLTQSIVYSDGWRAYSNLGAHGYIHDFVNHSQNFLKPLDNNVHTQTIERKWRSLKESIPTSSHGRSRNDHLIEFLYKSMYHNKKEWTQNFEITLRHLKNDPLACEINFEDVNIITYLLNVQLCFKG